jgi:hypothetical protein
MPCEFRQQINLVPGTKIDDQAPRLWLPVAGGHLRVVGWKYESPIADASRFLLVGGPYESENEARSDGLRARRAILLWALERRLSIDLGDNRRRGGLTAGGIEHFSQMVGAPVRDQLHGLDVYESREGLRFVNTEAEAHLQIGSSRTLERMAFWYQENRELTKKQELATELYCAAGFDTPFRSRFLTLMTALESLLEYQPRSAAVISLVTSMEEAVSSSTVAPHEKKSLLSSLTWLHDESIGQAGRRTADALLVGQTYESRKPGKYFSDCYELRSRLVHSGQVAADVDLLNVANSLQRFVGDLLHASIGIAAT